MVDYDVIHYRRELDRLLYRYKFISRDLEEFWLFAKRYLVVSKKAKTSKKKSTSVFKELSSQVILSDEEKAFFVSIETLRDRRIPPDIFTDLKTIVLAYLNFKKKEKAEKLKKIKESKENLPVFQYRDEITDSVKNERVVIMAGDTGCGKSTQVPQYLLQAGFNRIACTQPRRIACISLSKRVAYETQSESTSEIGYQIRFEKKRNDETKILFITEGLLLRQISGDGYLSGYDVVVLDEVHERHLQGDFLLGLLKCLSLQREDFKLILMSATINLHLFTQYFGSLAKVITVPGRLYPIQVNYAPVIVEEKALKKERLDPGPYIRILQMIDEKYPRSERGDLLVFLSGMNEITSLVDAVTTYNEKVNRWIILPLHSSLSLAQQDKVFDYPPEGFRKCIVSTNIAETSLTIDGVRFVIDSGMVKEMSFDAVCKMQRLKEFWVSKASADQRKGRAGRSGPGVCYRLYSEADYTAMSDFSSPEIQRVPLDSVLLQMISMGLPDSRKFPFLEAPHSEALENSILSLKQHGCLSADEKVTPLGKMLSSLPVDIQLGKMLIVGSMFHQIESALSLASSLSVQSPYTNRAFKDLSCETARRSLECDHGDPLTLLNALKEWLQVKKEGRINSEHMSSKRWAKTRGFEEQRFYEMIKLRSQFKDILRESGLLSCGDNYKGDEGLTSAERALRHGEVKLLKKMKRAHKEEETSGDRRKKKLKPDSWTIEDTAAEDSAVDIRDLDFRLSNDQSKLQDLVSGSTATSYKDLTMLKIILLSGLYPQVALPDEFNHCKGVNEQLFHTKGKPFVFLHPMSFFGNNTKVLQLQEPDLVHAPGFTSRNALSSKHQILCYMSLLETNKPYLVNTMRMPALQSLLLMANEIQTNSDFTVVVCDSWVKFKFPVAAPIEKLLMNVVKLRNSWDQLLTTRVEEKDGTQIEGVLSEGLIKLMLSEIVYCYKRLLPADLKYIYTMSPETNCFSGTNPFLEGFPIEPNQVLGGVKLTQYLTYNCLLEGGELISKTWECEHCGLLAPLSTLERLQHMHTCSKSHSSSNSTDGIGSSRCGLPRKPNSVLFTCPICSEEMYLTPIEILKHKKLHSA